MHDLIASTFPAKLIDFSNFLIIKKGFIFTCACADGMYHVRVHPKFLYSNATSHKWVLGAFAELLDNALDEVCNGATYVNMDMLPNSKDGGSMLLIEDNGGGMDPDKMRQCMSLGYSAKSKIANTIGQYGNGFKTSTMRLGVDVIVFSRCPGKDGKRHTQSVGLLSYTFLRSTGKEDIVVPIKVSRKHGSRMIVSHVPTPSKLSSPLGHKSAGISNGTRKNSVSEGAILGGSIHSESHSQVLQQLKEENQQLKKESKRGRRKS